MLTQKRLKEILHYNSKTGIFVWKIRLSHNIHVGDVAGTLDAKNYVVIVINKKQYKRSRLAWLYVYGVWPEGIVDHRNHITTDDWIKNLRDVTHSENAQNRNKANAGSITGVLGVGFNKRQGTYHVRIQINGKQKYIGEFLTLKIAEEIAIKEKRKLHPMAIL